MFPIKVLYMCVYNTLIPSNTNWYPISDATEQLISTLSLQPLEGTDVVLNNSTHSLKLYGKTVSGGRVTGLVRLAYSAKSGVTTKITIRAEEEGVAAAIITSVA